MSAFFADTSFYYALLSPSDQYHEAAVRLSAQVRGLIVTTEFVLLELGNAISAPRGRQMFVRFVEALRRDDQVKVVPASERLFDEALQLYAARKDKTWSLTDCTSFVVMQEEGLSEALSADRHFEQAGFTVLLK